MLLRRDGFGCSVMPREGSVRRGARACKVTWRRKQSLRCGCCLFTNRSMTSQVTVTLRYRATAVTLRVRVQPQLVSRFFFVISRTFESHCEGGLGHKRHNLGQTFANAKIAGVQITSQRFAMKEISFDFAAELFVCPILPCGDVSCFRSKVSSDV